MPAASRRGCNARSWTAPPGAVGDEDALPDGQCAVVPKQQEVEDGIQEPSAGEWVCSCGQKASSTERRWRRSSSPVAHNEGAEEGEEQQEDGEEHLELLVLVFVGKSVSTQRSRLLTGERGRGGEGGGREEGKGEEVEEEEMEEMEE